MIMSFLRSASALRSNSRRLAHSFRPMIEALESRQLLSGSSVAPPGDLHDHLIAPIAKAEFVQDNGHLTRMDVINLLNVVDGTVSAVFTNPQVSFTPATASGT
jgi:hypothetical protein